MRLNETLAAVNGSTVAEQLRRTVAEGVPHLRPQLEATYGQVFDRAEAVHDIEVEGASWSDPKQTRHWLASFYPANPKRLNCGFAQGFYLGRPMRRP